MLEMGHLDRAAAGSWPPLVAALATSTSRIVDGVALALSRFILPPPPASPEADAHAQAEAEQPHDESASTEREELIQSKAVGEVGEAADEIAEWRRRRRGVVIAPEGPAVPIAPAASVRSRHMPIPQRGERVKRPIQRVQPRRVAAQQ